MKKSLFSFILLCAPTLFAMQDSVVLFQRTCEQSDFLRDSILLLHDCDQPNQGEWLAFVTAVGFRERSADRTEGSTITLQLSKNQKLIFTEREHSNLFHYDISTSSYPNAPKLIGYLKTVELLPKIDKIHSKVTKHPKKLKKFLDLIS